MTEEQITLILIEWLEQKDWSIVSFDYPESGTGTRIAPDEKIGCEESDSFIPDIVAVKRQIAVFFENKDRFYKSDFEKVEVLKKSDCYKKGINDLLKDFLVKNIFYGIGLITEETEKIEQNKNKTDFIVLLDPKTQKVIVSHGKRIF